MRNDIVRPIVDLRDRALQKNRIAFGNRLVAIDDGRDTADPEARELFQRWHERFLELEEAADKDIAKLVKDMPIVKRMTKVKGIGPMLAAKLVSMIDIERADTVSALWKYSGFGLGEYWIDEQGKIIAPRDGWKWKVNPQGQKEKIQVTANPKPEWRLVSHRDVNIPGWCAVSNATLKKTCYLIASSFLKSNSPYRKVYDDARAYYSANRPDWTEAHRHNAALRKMGKMFLSHLWLTWRQLEGLPITYPYAHERLGHQHYYSPEDFGW